MTTERIYAKLVPIVKTYLPEDVDISAIEPDSNLTKDLNINSVHLVDIVLDVEDAFDIELANEDVENLHTVNDALEIIQKKIK
ncbi:MAG: phosphopantetheine-binding protein [Flavobacteriales bacterium]|jgi:acyl carrier protein|uniref:acyl carrier protein n=1 Tax=Candidatus Ulvibacter alkanivorans TaxID=2267620 RepID=UPI000DF16468|nr:phosphopantetheine-binding protein [Candidatus Ulvibacter alkanivorans]MCH2489055.1 phosphopantetheine-binding protein [Flavobacteriales bacterium]